MKEDTIRLVKKAIKGSKAAYGELIAQIMDIPEGSVKVYLYRAKKQMRRWLEADKAEYKEERRYAK